MAVTILLGAPGFGKSTYLASIVKEAQKKGLNVYSNVYIEGAFMLDIKQDFNYYRMENGLVVVDEGATEWSNRKWQEFSDRNERFFQMHRHYNLDVIVSCQNHEDLDAKIKRLTTKILVCKKALLYPWFIKIKSISQDVDINPDNTAIVSVYKWKHPLVGTRYKFAPPLWKLFDSYFQDILNDKDWVKWSKENKNYYIKNYTEIIGTAKKKTPSVSRL